MTTDELIYSGTSSGMTASDVKHLVVDLRSGKVEQRWFDSYDEAQEFIASALALQRDVDRLD